MPTGPGGLDPNGIWLYGEDDTEALASDLLNLGMESVSDAIGSLPTPADPAILQVVSVSKTDTFTTSSATFTPITGLTASITPSSTSSKILVMIQLSYAQANNSGYGHFQIAGGNTASYVGDSAGSRVSAVFGGYSDPSNRNQLFSGSMVYLDSPATTSSTTYQAESRTSGSGAVYINRSAADPDTTGNTRGASTITLMEVAG